MLPADERRPVGLLRGRRADRILHQLPPREASEHLVTLARERAKAAVTISRSRSSSSSPETKAPRLARQRLRGLFGPLTHRLAFQFLLLEILLALKRAAPRVSCARRRCPQPAWRRQPVSARTLRRSSRSRPRAAAPSQRDRRVPSACARTQPGCARSLPRSQAALHLRQLYRSASAPRRRVPDGPRQSPAVASAAPRVCAADPPRRAFYAGPWPRVRRAEPRVAPLHARASPSLGSR